jgi:octaprenyl-diphosphate synthase
MRLSTHSDIAQAYELISDELRRVKEVIDGQLAGADEPTKQLLDAFGKNGGKMIRPALVILAGRACGRVTDEHIHVAAIIEMIHNATLLHDDVIDDGKTRRGFETVNSLWGNEAAVLLGDFMLSKVFGMCTLLDKQVMEIISETTMRTCEGELRQIMQRLNWRLSEAEYIEIITDKTAAIFAACCRLGAFLAKGSKKEQEKLTHFGHDIGIAFQITDDLLDIVGEETQTGKTGGSDVDKNKLTLPVINLLANTEENQKGEMIKKLVSASDSKHAFAEILKSNGSLEYSFSRAKEYVSKATSELAPLAGSPAKDALIKTANFITERVTL